MYFVGIFILNLVCRSADLRATAISNLKLTFEVVCAVKVSEDVNEILFCLPTAWPTSFLTSSAQPSEEFRKSLKTLQDLIHLQNKQQAKDSIRVTAQLEQLKLL